MKRINIFLALSLISVFLGCQAEKKPLKIGVIAPMQTENGKLLIHALEMSLEEINQTGGILGRKVTLLPIDDQNQADAAVRNLRAFLKNDKPDLLIGGFSSGVVLRLMDVMAENKILWLGTGGAHPAIIGKIKKDYERYKYYFRVGAIDALEQAKAIVRFTNEVFRSQYGYEDYAILGTDIKWSRFILDYVKNALKKNGFKLKYEDYFSANTQDFESYFRRAEKSGAKFIINYTLGSEGTTYIKQYHDLNIKLPEIGTHGLGGRREWWSETGGKCIWDLRIIFASNLKKLVDFQDKFWKRYEKSPGVLSWFGYDALYVLKEAALKAKSLNTEQLIRALEKIDFQAGILRYRFTRYHDLTYGHRGNQFYIGPVYFQWKPGGKLVPIWPKNEAKNSYELPLWIRQKK